MPAKRLCSIQGCNKPHYGKGFCNLHWRRNHKHGNPYFAEYRAPKGVPLAWLLAHVGFKGDECLLWPFAKNTWGYGDLWVDRRHVRANRYMCELAHGAPPSASHEALHSCGNGHLACVNPTHLRWGTSAENKADTLAHGKRLRGEMSVKSKLTRVDVLLIRSLLSEGISQRVIARRFNICQQAVSDIKMGHNWGWL